MPRRVSTNLLSIPQVVALMLSAAAYLLSWLYRNSLLCCPHGPLSLNELCRGAPVIRLGFAGPTELRSTIKAPMKKNVRGRLGYGIWTNIKVFPQYFRQPSWALLFSDGPGVTPACYVSCATSSYPAVNSRAVQHAGQHTGGKLLPWRLVAYERDKVS